jgi:CRISPR-associated endonuclease/helicase Cas3
MTNADLVEALEDQAQGLVIVNSRQHALELYRDAETAGLEGIVHLTTRQYAAHRRRILGDVRERLANGQACRVIATSLVEAGVDLDFPCVWRAEAGLDQIAQAAGRCNRNGRRPVAESIVTVFAAPDYPPPPEIKNLSGDMARMADKFDDLLSPAAIEAFFGEVYWRLDKGVDRDGILDAFRIGRSRHGVTNFDYRRVAEKFRMIESGMTPVIVPRDEKAQKWVEKLEIKEVPSGTIARELQAYTVQVPPKARNLLLKGHVRFFAENLRCDQFAVLVTPSLYREDTGLIWEDAEYLALEGTII